MQGKIQYSDKYYDDEYEYRWVTILAQITTLSGLFGVQACSAPQRNGPASPENPPHDGSRVETNWGTAE